MKKWIIATRPWSFPVSSFSVLVTSAYLFWRGWEVNGLLVLWATVGIILFHAAGNLLSDWYDYKKGIDAEDTYGSKTLTSGMLTSRQVLIYGIVMLVLASINGLGIAAVSGWGLLIFGVLGALFTILYPWMKTHAMGDLCIFLEYGIIPALGTAYAICPSLHPQPSTLNPRPITLDLYLDALWIILAFATITIAVLHANNTRDVRTDDRAHVRTFAMQLGKEMSIIMYIVELMVPSMWVLAGVCNGAMPWLCLLVPAATLPKAFANCRIMTRFYSDQDAINFLDEKTAQLQLINGLTLCVLLVAAALLGL